MKKKTFILISLIYFFTLFHCQTPQETSTPDSDSKPETSRDRSAKPAEVKPKEVPTEVIDLNQIKIVPMPDPESGVLKITKNKEGKPIILLSLETSNSGLDLVGSILRGEVLEHAIVIRNEKGEEIGRAPVNVLQYEVEEIATNKGQKKILLTESGTEVEIKKSNELPPIQKKASIRTFTREELIPQYVEINKNLGEGSYVSVNLELTLAKPFAELDCYSSELDENESSCSRDFHNSIKTEIKNSISEKESILSRAISEMKEDSLPKEYREQLILRLRKNTNEYRSDIRESVKNINQQKLESKPALGTYYYREWRLSNTPKYFPISYVDPPKIERKKKTQTDYTYFGPNEESTEAIEEADIKSKNIIIEIAPSDASVSLEKKSQISEDSQKMSLEQAQRQDIGVGSNCIIYLKSGKFFRAKIVSLDGYQSIQVEVNGNVMDVLKKDIEVIYIPKSSLD